MPRINVLHTSIKIFSLLFITLIYQCVSEVDTQLQPGDLLFQDLSCGPLCDAIEKVTEGYGGRDFSHCGMVVESVDGLKVIEAIGKEVQLTDLDAFLARSEDTSSLMNTVVARLTGQSEKTIHDAIHHALDLLGEPYDDAFLPDNNSWYCSEMIHYAFKKANNNEDVFHLEPMTFKDPDTGEFFPAWIEYYDQLKIPIPEGELGLNPGSISRSKHLTVLDIQSISR